MLFGFYAPPSNCPVGSQYFQKCGKIKDEYDFVAEIVVS